MHDSARVCSLLACPKSGIAPRPPQVPRSNPSIVTDPRLRPPARFTTYRSLLTPLAMLIANDKLLETELTLSVPAPSAFLIASICPTFFSPAPLRAFLIGTPIRLETDLTHSQQTRKHFLIGTIRPTLAPAPLSTHHLSLITHHCFTQFRFATNRIRKIVALMKTKEKPRSIRCKFPSCAIGVPAAATQCRPVPGTRNFPCFRRNRIAACLGVLAVLTCPAASGPIWFAW